MRNLIVVSEDDEHYYCKEHRRGHGYLSHVILKKKVKEDEIENDYFGNPMFIHMRA